MGYNNLRVSSIEMGGGGTDFKTIPLASLVRLPNTGTTYTRMTCNYAYHERGAALVLRRVPWTGRSRSERDGKKKLFRPDPVESREPSSHLLLSCHRACGTRALVFHAINSREFRQRTRTKRARDVSTRLVSIRPPRTCVFCLDRSVYLHAAAAVCFLLLFLPFPLAFRRLLARPANGQSYGPRADARNNRGDIYTV